MKKRSFFDLEDTSKSAVINPEMTIRKYQQHKYGEFFGQEVEPTEMVDKIDKYINAHETYLANLKELKNKVVEVIRKENAVSFEIAVKTMSVEDLEAALEAKKQALESVSAA